MSKDIHWSYVGETNPKQWGKLDPTFAMCEKGQKQSPINITNPVAQTLSELDVHYQPTPLNVTNNGHAIQVDCEPGSYIVVGDTRYDLLQFHFHAPSEHTVDGAYLAMELHLVHRSAAGQIAVLGVLLSDGPANVALQPIWTHMPTEIGTTTNTDLHVNAQDLLPDVRTTYRYSGSLTTPPCTEGVQWLVMTETIPVSEQQVAIFKKIFPFNNRPIQPLKGREVVVG